MRMLMLNNEFPPLGGGTATVNLMLFREFSRMDDLEIDLVTSERGKDYEEERFSKNITLHKVPVNNRNIHHAGNRELITYTLLSYKKSLQLMGTNPYDLAMAWSAVPAGAVAWKLRKKGLRYVVRTGGADIPGFEKRYQWMYPFLSPIIRRVWNRAEDVIVKCQGEASMIRKLAPDRSLTEIPNGADLDLYSPGAECSDNGPLKLLFVGRLIERKGLPHLLEAVKCLVDGGRNLRLEIIGTGDLDDACRSQAKALDLEDRITFRGYVEREHLPETYRNAHIFVLPSYNEGMSVSTLEAMASGLPVVVTRTGGVEELVTEGENGLTFDWADVQTLVKHLKAFDSDRALVRRMALAARQRAERLSWQNIATRYRDYFLALHRTGHDGKPPATVRRG